MSMCLEILPTTYFSKMKDNLLKKRQLLQDDYDTFLEELSKNPDSGDVIPGSSKDTIKISIQRKMWWV